MYGIYCPYVICHLHISHNAPYLSPSAPRSPRPPQKIGLTFAFYFSWVLQPSLKRTKFKTMLMQNFGAWGGGGGVGWGNKVHYGRCASGV